jgi:hypothetical protein
MNGRQRFMLEPRAFLWTLQWFGDYHGAKGLEAPTSVVTHLRSLATRPITPLTQSIPWESNPPKEIANPLARPTSSLLRVPCLRGMPPTAYLFKLSQGPGRL